MSTARCLGLAYCETPLGTLRIVGTQREISRILFPHEELAEEIAPRPEFGVLAACVEQLRDYFNGRLQAFDLPLSLGKTSSFRARALKQLSTVGFGQRLTYAQLALLAGNPRATRAAGTACATNPLPIVVPCHRIVRSDGSLGQYRGGVPAKQFLLEFESQAINDSDQAILLDTPTN